MLQDMNSTNHTYINGRVVSDDAEMLHDGDRICLSDEEFEFFLNIWDVAKKGDLMENHIFNGKIVELEDGEEAVSYRLKCNDDFMILDIR